MSRLMNAILKGDDDVRVEEQSLVGWGAFSSSIRGWIKKGGFPLLRCSCLWGVKLAGGNCEEARHGSARLTPSRRDQGTKLNQIFPIVTPPYIPFSTLLQESWQKIVRQS